MKFFFLIFTGINLCNITSSAQTINASTLNIGGGNFTNNNIVLEWSIGESSVTQTFNTYYNILLTHGVLQPFTSTYYWSQRGILADIGVYPIPTYNNVNVSFLSKLKGKVSLQLFDVGFRLVGTKEFTNIGLSEIIQLNLENLSSGTYILNITLTNEMQYAVLLKSYKIQKIK